MCTCPDCQAADDNDAPDRLKRAQKAFMEGDTGWYKELGSVTNRYARMTGKVQFRKPEIYLNAPFP